ncbi:uncharacterized protein LOC133791601 [Humulus lupulus]|uniref:uncharacterized protein LOC133791601 n=1 Tax=Humulus lupulus TaxID=3486 RepID=UPI002B410854|nr:uncharacterized protein LOC133791601 [Humulus lupulus]
MVAASNPNTGERPMPNIPEEQIPHDEDYPRRLGKQLMLAEATKHNEELAKQVAGTQTPPRRPRGRPLGSTAARRAEQMPPPASQPIWPRPQRSNRAEGTTNPIVEAQTGTGNNRAPSMARNPNPNATQNNPGFDQENLGPFRLGNGRQPPSLIRNPPSPIRHPSPVQEVPRPTHRDGNRWARHGQGNEKEATRDRKTPQPAGSQMSRSHTTGTRRPAGDPPHNN